MGAAAAPRLFTTKIKRVSQAGHRHASSTLFISRCQSGLGSKEGASNGTVCPQVVVLSAE